MARNAVSVGCTPNIGPRGIARRARNANLWTGLAFGALIGLLMTRPPAAAWLFLAIPVGLATNGWLQVRERT